MVGQAEPPADRSSLVLFEEEAPAGKIQTTGVGPFDLLGASAALSTAIRRLTRPTDVLWLRECRALFEDRYDLLLFDTAAAITVLSLNALVAADVVLIPVLPEYQPVVGGEQTYQTAQLVRKRLNPDMKAARFLLTMVDGRKKNHLAYRKYLRDRYENRVLKTVIRTCTTLSLSHRDGSSVFETNPRARGSIDYAAATDELLGLFEEQGLRPAPKHGFENDTSGVREPAEGSVLVTNSPLT
jgi:chromosome partitioning protein